MKKVICRDVRGGRHEVAVADENFGEEKKQYTRKAEWVPLELIRGLKFYHPVDSIAIIQKAIGLLQ